MSFDYYNTLKEGNKNLVARVRLSKRDLDRYRPIIKLSLWNRIYKRLFPIRFYVNEYYRKYVIRTTLPRFLEQVDKFSKNLQTYL